MTSRRLRRTSTVVALAALAAPLLLSAASPAEGGGASKWKLVSTSNVQTTITTPSIVKFGGNYEVIWVSGSGGSWALNERILNAAGTPTGSVIQPLKNWAGIALDPTLMAYGKGQLIAFGGDRTGTGGPYESDAVYDLQSSDGTHWTLDHGSLSAADGARNGGTAAVNDNGTIIVGLARQDGVQYHINVGGPSPDNPASASADPITATTGNFSADPGLGVDRVSHKVYALWYSNSGINGQDGVNAQQIYPSPGSRIHAPGSSNPTTKSAGVQQDLSAVARAGGGVYTAYRTPNSFAIIVWKVGASKPLATIPDKKWGVSNIVLAAGPGGRLWLYWVDRNGWRATRSNKAATRFGPVTVAGLPTKTDIENGEIAGYGAAGPLEAVATVTTSTNVNEIIARQFLPRLSVKAAHSVRRGKRLTVKVTDAGDPVKGATVHFGKASKTTNSHGKARFKVGRHAKLGRVKITATIKGYTGATTHTKVKR